jgi:hypothetical protein
MVFLSYGVVAAGRLSKKPKKRLGKKAIAGTIDFYSEINIPPNFTAERAENAEASENPSVDWNALKLCALCDLRVDKSLVFFDCAAIAHLKENILLPNKVGKILREETTLGRAIAMKEFIFVDGVIVRKLIGDLGYHILLNVLRIPSPMHEICNAVELSNYSFVYSRLKFDEKNGCDCENYIGTTCILRLYQDQI